MTRTESQWIALGLSGEEMGVSVDGVQWNETGGHPGIVDAAGTDAVLVGIGRTNERTMFTLWARMQGGAWQQVHVSGSGAAFTDVAYASGKWVATHDDGAILSSADANHWETWRAPGAKDRLLGVAGHRNTWVAVGVDYEAGGQGVIFTSLDGSPWQRVYLGTGALHGVATDGDSWLAVGDEAILESEAGTTWANAPLPEPRPAGPRGFHQVAGDGCAWVVTEPGWIHTIVGGQWTSLRSSHFGGVASEPCTAPYAPDAGGLTAQSAPREAPSGGTFAPIVIMLVMVLVGSRRAVASGPQD